MELKVSINLLRRMIEYCDWFINCANSHEFIRQATLDKDTIWFILHRENRKEILVFRSRKKMLKVLLDLEFLKRMTDYIDVYIEHCRIYDQLKEAMKDKIRIAKLKRMFEPRSRVIRKYYPLKVKAV